MKSYRIPDTLIESLRKGSVLERAAIEPLIPSFEDEAEYRLKLVKLKTKLERKLRAAGKPMTIRIRENGQALAFLTDAEASDYNRRYHNSYLHRARSRHDSMMEVDVTALGPDERKTHERSVLVQSAIQTGIETVRRQVQHVAHQRNTPGLNSTED